ncbi:hypothetical protein Q4601_10305 [Shewanella sp. 1_MG-2023]|uniref:Uncharacterized protein n=1 Tax=Shewanella electrodiphila TaxID=934143 RepID=A0ABT0KT49_9GAMM|nr:MULTISPECIES: hypothetical protein [Shewanella]MCC4834205.1 hypothetical protein [Shewanella sp. 10N.7]MCL1046721.1 hypothetical protein [Shewanella electrodiphila]MDO6611209.1 hypothetical protein [Shewanella sp. 7_MG-2023]MDO6770914.1 hypothetical protein [Shewanella sp. 2_MG-2023]MDO6794699.1 hypothetical protein [Shewanella sp. 1_MG-2023]
MANITETIPNDTEIEAMVTPRNKRSAEIIERKRQVKRRLDDYLEQAELRKNLDDELF